VDERKGGSGTVCATRWERRGARYDGDAERGAGGSGRDAKLTEAGRGRAAPWIRGRKREREEEIDRWGRNGLNRF
jgi:hypothetical protein